MSRGRYRPIDPPERLTEARIDVMQREPGGLWFIVLTEPAPHRPAGIKRDLAAEPTIELAKARAHALAPGLVDADRVRICGPLIDIVNPGRYRS